MEIRLNKFEGKFEKTLGVCETFGEVFAKFFDCK